MNFTEIDPINKAFRMMAREQKFDVSEMAIVSYLQAKAYDKPLVLMPATMLGAFSTVPCCTIPNATRCGRKTCRAAE